MAVNYLPRAKFFVNKGKPAVIAAVAKGNAAAAIAVAAAAKGSDKVAVKAAVADGAHYTSITKIR